MPQSQGDIPRAVRRRTVLAVLIGALLVAEPARAHPQTTLDPVSPQGDELAHLWWFMLIAASAVVAVVVALALLAVLRRRGRAGDRLAGRLSGMWFVGIGGIAVPLVILAVLFALTLETLVETAPGSNDDADLEIEVVGKQWFWVVRYPDTAGAVTANELHVPVGVPVRVTVTTDDVLHSFWVPRLNRKIDLVPGQENAVTFTATAPGVYRGQCAEFCGVQHGHMGLLVIAQEHTAFDAWLARQARSAVEPVEPSRIRGERVFMDSGCAACHTIRGTEARGDIGPDLTHLAGRRTLAAATIPNTRGDLGRWILGPQGIKPGNRMPAIDLTGPELRDVLDYLGGLD